MRRLRPAEVGWRLGTAKEPHGGELWVPWDRTAGVVGPQGSGKTLDLLAPALIDAPGAALTTLTKVDDLLLTFTARSGDGRPCVVLDPFAGSGTTLLVARNLGRDAVGLDLSYAYLHDQARARLQLDALDAWQNGGTDNGDCEPLDALPLFAQEAR